jgi:hypothetical protein
MRSSSTATPFVCPSRLAPPRSSSSLPRPQLYRRLPYAVSEGGRYINNIPITYGGSNSDELWTRALKFMLTDVKWIVAWAAKHSC